MRAKTAYFAVFGVISSDPSREWYGLDIAKMAKIGSGKLYPALARLERGGDITSRNDEGGRRVYKLNTEGET